MNKPCRTVNMFAENHIYGIKDLKSYVKALVESPSSLSLLLDRDMHVLYCSERLLRLANMPEGATLEGMPASEAFDKLRSPDAAGSGQRRLMRIMSGEDYFAEEDVIVWPDGERRYYRICYKRILDDPIDFGEILITLQDIGDIRRSEAAQVLSNMSYALRAPLQNIMNLSESALDEAVPRKTAKYVERILIQSKCLLQIIDEVANVSDIQSGRVEAENIPFDLRELLDSCKNAILPTAYERGIGLLFSPGATIAHTLIGDPAKLRQVLTNLLSHAVTCSGGAMVSLSVSLESATEKTIALRFEVADDGNGLTPEQVASVYGPFIRTTAGATAGAAAGGTKTEAAHAEEPQKESAQAGAAQIPGVFWTGLPATNSVLRLMGSRLVVESAVGAGTKAFFVVHFALAQAGVAAEIPAAEKSAATETLAAAASERANAPPGARETEKARQLLAKLEPLLRNRNPDCLSLIDGLHAIAGSGKLIEHMEGFRFIEALKSFAELKERLAL